MSESKKRKGTQSDDTSTSVGSTLKKHKQNKLEFIAIKPITSLLPEDEQFRYILDMGERMKHLLPISTNLHNDAKRNEEEYHSKLKKMKVIAEDADIDDSVKSHTIRQISLEAKDLLRDVHEYKIASKEIMKEKRKIESALSNVTKACSYWKNIDAVIYGEWLLIEIVGERLLAKFNSVEEKDAHEKRGQEIIDIESTSASAANDKEGICNPTNDETVDIDSILRPGEKARPERVIKMKGINTKYTHSAKYPFITYQDYKEQMNGGKQRKKEKLHQHGFEWVDGCVKCVLCNIRFRQTRSMHRHIVNPQHQNILRKKKMAFSNYISVVSKR